MPETSEKTPDKIRAPYGSWRSPVTAETVSAAGVRLSSVSVDGDDPTRLTTNNSLESSPRFSRDGGSILFVSNSYGDSDIFLMRRDGSSQTRITATDEEDVSPDL